MLEVPLLLRVPYPQQVALRYGVEYPPHVPYPLSFPAGVFSHFPLECLLALCPHTVLTRVHKIENLAFSH
jgi:hypothetical protein